jgi:hypothetical protein
MTWPAGAEATVAGQVTLDADQRRAVVERLGELIKEHYIEPDTAVQITTLLQRWLQDGRFDGLESPADFAGALTQELEAFDRHFHVTWRPPDDEGPPAQGHTEEAEAEWAQQSRLLNFGFERVERLTGNLGYLDLRYFDNPSWAGETAAAAMGFLANMDAVIVDVRRNGGGEPGMVQLLMSYFFESEPVHYNTFVDRSSTEVRQLWTLPYVPGQRLPEVDLYVLTSARTGSAAEGFAYCLQALERATLVGEATGGAANPGETFAIDDSFTVFISTGKPVNPITGENWERTGVQPDVAVDSDTALKQARIMALEALLESSRDPAARRERQWALEALRIADGPVSLAPDSLAQFPGTYGKNVVRLAEGGLTFQRGRRLQRRMVPLGGDRFLLEDVDGFRLEFGRDDTGSVVRLIAKWSDGHVEASPRE